MRFAKIASAVGLWATALVLAGGNLWVTASRSLIPPAVSGTVASRTVRHEKHPGHDDVCLWTMADGRELHVDQAVYSLVPEGSTIAKRRFARTLTVVSTRGPTQEIVLEFSDDFRGMCLAMPLAVLIAAAAAWGAAKPQGQAASR